MQCTTLNVICRLIFIFIGRVCVSFYNFNYNQTILSHKQYYHTISNEI